MQNDWWTGLAERTQRYADMGEMRAFYEALKTVYGPSHQIQAPLRSSSTLFEWKYPADREGRHPPALFRTFRGLFSGRRTAQESSRSKISQVDLKLELDDSHTREEIKKATMQLKVEKSPGLDGIPAEVYQHGEEAVLDKLQDMFTNRWERGTLPKDLRDAVIVSLYKNKGEKSVFKLSRHHSALHCRQNLGWRLAA